MRVALVVLALALLGCSRSRVEDDLAHPARTVVREPGLVVHAPYDEEATARWVALVRAERERVVALLELADTTLEVRLVPVGAGPGPGGVPSLERLLAATHPSKEGYGGWGGVTDGEGGLAVVYVPDDPFLASLAEDAVEATVRHELVHVLAPRAGLPQQPRWYVEGLARVVEERVPDADGHLVRDALSPMALLVAARAPDPTLAEVLAWQPWDGGAADADEGRRYALAASFMDHLLATRPEQGLPAAAAAVAALSPAELAAQEGPWLASLAALDPLAEAEALAGSPDDDDAARAVMRLRVLVFDLRWPGAAGPRGDALALAALQRPALRESAFTYLGLARARALPAGTVDALATSADDELCVLGQALRQRRDEPVDEARVAAAWARLSAERRAQLGVARHLLGLPLSPAPPGTTP